MFLSQKIQPPLGLLIRFLPVSKALDVLAATQTSIQHTVSVQEMLKQPRISYQQYQHQRPQPRMARL